MADVVVRELTAAFGVEVSGVDLHAPLDDETCRVLRDVFDRRGVLLFRDVDLSHAEQTRLSKMLILKEDAPEGTPGPELDDNFYISNRRPDSAAPFGRLQFHADMMWSDQPFQVLSLYGVEVEQSAVPTTFVSEAYAWATLPEELRVRVEGLQALHTAGDVRRGDMTDVLLTEVERPPFTVTPIARPHARTGEMVLNVCEQMTKEVVGLAPDESERLLEELFAHLYDPSSRWNHDWRERDLVVWDNLAIQHARQNVLTDGPARTLRKVASPIPQLNFDELPTYSSAQ